MSPMEAAQAMGFVWDQWTLLDVVERYPSVAMAMADVAKGVHPLAAAARYDLPVTDPDGIDWKVLIHA